MQSIITWKRSYCFIIANMICLYIFSQNTNSPYSVYGIGDIDNGSYNRTSGMGGTGLAIKSSVFLIDNNPAALAGLGRSFYVASIAATGKSSTFSGDPINSTNSNSKDFWIKRFTLAVKINKFWASGFGFNQFSNVNYNFAGSKFIEGSADSYAATYQGDGGLNEYHWTNAVSLGKHFSLGLKSSFISGSINQTEILDDPNSQASISTKQQDYISNFRFQSGLQYETALNKKWDLSLGGKFSPKTRLSADRTLTVTENNVVVVNDRYIKNDRFYLPDTYAAGIALKHNKTTTYAVDYTREDWSSLGIKDQGWQLINSNRISAGAEFSSFKNDRGFLVENRFYQVGAFLNNSYLQVRNTPINEWGMTVGMGGSLRNSFLYTLSLQGGVRGTTQQKLIKETFVGFTLSLSYRDFLFSKGKRYD
ncbi:MAG: hypothetical protein JWM28_2794 [Chitinophagaceae bacterium]|nr:hypothetical protein [Chitinophagaceae bacterium]